MSTQQHLYFVLMALGRSGADTNALCEILLDGRMGFDHDAVRALGEANEAAVSWVFNSLLPNPSTNAAEILRSLRAAAQAARDTQ
jgi:hypothetical protein